MPKYPSSITGAAGEHLVAGRLAAMGYVVALTRGGSPTADLLVTNPEGDPPLTIQVKTSVWAGKWHKRKKESNHWEWPISKKAADIQDERLLYAFVDLQNWPDARDESRYQVFIVPSAVVAAWVSTGVEKKWSRIFFWIMESQREKYLGRWDLLEEVLPRPGSKA